MNYIFTSFVLMLLLSERFIYISLDFDEERETAQDQIQYHNQAMTNEKYKQYYTI